MITCRQFEEFIVEYLEDGLTAHQRRLFEFHLKLCRECRDYLAAYKVSMEAAKQGLSDDDMLVPDEVPDDLVAAVIASRGTSD
jgi:predicted anti-sigma-YlaC factor YlaD